MILGEAGTKDLLTASQLAHVARTIESACSNGFNSSSSNSGVGNSSTSNSSANSSSKMADLLACLRHLSAFSEYSPEALLPLSHLLLLPLYMSHSMLNSSSASCNEQSSVAACWFMPSGTVHGSASSASSSMLRSNAENVEVISLSVRLLLRLLLLQPDNRAIQSGILGAVVTGGNGKGHASEGGVKGLPGTSLLQWIPDELIVGMDRVCPQMRKDLRLWCLRYKPSIISLLQ